jgi:hypothetical protein
MPASRARMMAAGRSGAGQCIGAIAFLARELQVLGVLDHVPRPAHVSGPHCGLATFL